jgi:hypothetical protein
MASVNLSAPVALYLHIRVRQGFETKLVEFLRGAKAFYEGPGGIRVRLLQDAVDPLSFIEIIEYEHNKAFENDDLRVKSDSAMKCYLYDWQSLLDGKADTKKYFDLSGQLEQ